MTQPTRRTYTAQAPGHPPLASKRKGQGARQLAEQHFGARLTVRETAA